MNLRQRIVKLFYPVLKNRLKSPATTLVLENKDNKQPLKSFYDLTVNLGNGKVVNFDTFKGKKVLLVNTASSCGFTPQFEKLQQLQDQYADKLVILGFPANDFKEQEKAADGEIESFCQVNYGVKFQIAAKSVVISSPTQNPVFKWLTQAEQNGWNTQAPTWNFCKYLIDENGVLKGYFASAIDPLEIPIR